TDIETAYNGGNNESDGFTVAPYAAYLFNDTFSADVTFGYTSLDYDTDRIDNVSGGTITGDFDSDRLFTAVNLNAIRSFNQLVIAGRVGLLYTEEEQDGYSEAGPNTARTIGERNLDLFQFVGGIDVAYSAGMVEPFVSLHYFNDLSRDNGEDAGGLPGSVGATQPDDDDEFQVGGGVRYFGNNFSGSLEGYTVLGRDKFDATTFMLTFRLDL
ncbi:MAG TPA: autotransporter outer membrane beta-barrel domain-containing protein, partial [Gammaproteobacteria bacterium]|nr:autotransporter outer membrane beta-barrel domain-containing protein [Gammaproteobacteria bacterium]